MNPIQLSKHIHESFVDYLSTIFNVNRDGQQSTLQAAIQGSFRASNALMRGPYLEVTPPYKRGKSIIQLCDEGILSSQWRTLAEDNFPMPMNASLYQHQERAIRSYHSGRSLVISSGTGSGKTEGFLIPILNDLLENPQLGVRAVLIYPMNALVNDQLDRLRRVLKDTNITFGRYTSELVNSEKDGRKEDTLPNEVVSRETIRDGSLIPQILITNYAMLEYLLLRPEDSRLFESGMWRFLVLDEAHTYSGAQGIEVAYLIRRLKQRLNKRQGDMLCIATSATLTDDTQVAVKFASDIFGEVLNLKILSLVKKILIMYQVFILKK
ncbi:MAG: DEAD/DEAH box helicase [Anaerolineae bacterium]|nr:DEAD/DEAH box helicase [Anaerolineae bacterium]